MSELRNEYRLIGFFSDIQIGDIVVDRASWAIDVGIDPQKNVKPDPKEFVPLKRSVSGTFSGTLPTNDNIMTLLEIGDPTHIVTHASKRPAWWGRLKHAIARTPWPDYVITEGDAWVDVELFNSRVKGNLRYAGPLTIYAEPRSWLEQRWDRLCSLLRRPFQ